MFTRRTQWTRSPNRLTQIWQARLCSGLPALDLTESNPTRCGFRYPEEKILRALSDPRALLYEPSPRGLAAARVAVAEDLTAQARESNATDSGATMTLADPDRIILTASTSEAYAWLFKLLCERGDEVLIPRPSYPLFDFLAELEEVAPVPYPFRYEGTWRIDLEAIEDAMNARTKAVVVVHPNNPTGNFLRTREWERLGKLCADRGIAVISDEVFHEYAFVRSDDPGNDLAPSLAANAPCLAFSLGGLSKAAGLPQIKVGWIRAGGPDALVQEALARLEVIADTYLSVNTPAQWALPALLGMRRSIRDQILDRIRSNRRWIVDQAAADRHAAWELLEADGGWYAVLRVPATRSEDEWCCRLAEDCGVLVHPGYFFDFDREAFLVASLLPEEERFQEGMGRVFDLAR